MQQRLLQYLIWLDFTLQAAYRTSTDRICMTDNGHYVKRRFLANMLKCLQIWTQENGLLQALAFAFS
jgi:hypothetical protein